MTKIKFGIAAAFLILSPLISFAQDSTVVSDFEMWAGVSVKKSFLEKKLDLALTQEFRFDDNSTHLNQFFTELKAEYEFIDGLSFGLGYRFIRNNKNSGYTNEQRIIADLSYKHKLDRLSLSYRFRFQNHDEIGLSHSDGDDITKKYRLRVKAEYNISNWKLDPYLSIEGFFAQEKMGINYVETITETRKVSGFEKIRFTFGTKYKINKLISIGAFYRIEQEIKSYPNVYNTPATYYIGGLNLSFKL
jgi:Protein of unknown function (DUF2490)